MFFIKTSNGMWMPCGPKQPGAVQISMQELAAQGQASQVRQILLGLIFWFCLFLVHVVAFLMLQGFYK